MPNIHFRVSYKFRKVFLSWLFMTSWRVELLVWPFLPKEHAHQRASFSCTARDMLRKNVFTAYLCVFVCKGKITLFILPKNPAALCEHVMQFVFWGQKRSFSSVFVGESQFDAGFVLCLILKDGAAGSRSRFRTSDAKWNGIKCRCFVGNCFVGNRHSSAG